MSNVQHRKDLQDPSDQPGISLIIPTMNRAAALALCLEHLERQSFSGFEVIVVDDGSTDETEAWMERYVAGGALRLRYLRQPNSGPAHARNLAISLARAPLCLILGDDICGSPGFVETHLRFHLEHPDPRVAALGFTRWSETGQTVTPFMRWLDESGSQFAYGDLLRGVKPEWRHFYTSNLSVKTELLLANPFDESFTGRAWMMEDMELGYRLETRHGMKLVFLPEALAAHIHPTDLFKACHRAYNAGLSALIFDRLWPDRPKTSHGWLHRVLLGLLYWNRWLLSPATWTIERITRVWCPNPFLGSLLAYHTMVARRKGE